MRLVSARSRVRSSLEARPFIRHGVVGNISACHADARGSIPRDGVVFLFAVFFFFFALVTRPAQPCHAPVAQLAARRSHNPKVASSILVWGSLTIFLLFSQPRSPPNGLTRGRPKHRLDGRAVQGASLRH